jgi:2'-5' RNA ligase
MGVYASLDVANKTAQVIANIVVATLRDEYAEQPNKFLTPDKYHTTLLYSREGNHEAITVSSNQHTAKIASLEQWDTHDVCLVAKLECDSLQKRHKYLMTKHNLQWDYPDYQPHITLLYDIKLDGATYEKLSKSLVGKTVQLMNEKIESLNEDHSDTED